MVKGPLFSSRRMQEGPVKLQIWWEENPRIIVTNRMRVSGGGCECECQGGGGITVKVFILGSGRYEQGRCHEFEDVGVNALEGGGSKQ